MFFCGHDGWKTCAEYELSSGDIHGVWRGGVTDGTGRVGAKRRATYTRTRSYPIFHMDQQIAAHTRTGVHQGPLLSLYVLYLELGVSRGYDYTKPFQLLTRAQYI